MIKMILLTFLALVITSISYSQEWVNYTNGNDIQCIFIDKNEAWVGTARGGLVKVDVNDYKTVFYNKANSGLPDNQIRAIQIDSLGRKWIATARGIAIFDGNNWEIMNNLNSILPSENISNIFIHKSNIWISSYSGGSLSHYNGVDWKVYDNKILAEFDNPIFSMAIDSNNVTWIGTNQELLKYEDGNWTVFNSGNSSFPGGSVYPISVDSENNKWFGLILKGLVKYNDTLFEIFNSQNSPLPSDWVTTVNFDSNANVWIGMQSIGNEPGGFAIKSDSIWTLYSMENSELPSNTIEIIEFDDKGVAWIGTRNGLVLFDGNNWQKINTSNSILPYSIGSAIKSDRNGNIWIGTGWGLIHVNGNNWEIYDTSNSNIPSNWVTCIDFDKNGNVWIGTIDNGIGKFDGNSWESFNSSSIPQIANRIYDIAVHGNNGIWAAMGSGVGFYDYTNWVFYDSTNSPSIYSLYSSITDIAVDSQSNVWISISEKGLAKFDGVNWSRYYDVPIYYTTKKLSQHFLPIPDNNVNDIAVDTFGTVWIGTAYEGVFKFVNNIWVSEDSINFKLPDKNVSYLIIDKKNEMSVIMENGSVGIHENNQWIFFDESNSGLPSSTISGIATDKNNKKWISTLFNGIAVYSPGELTNFDINGKLYSNNPVRVFPNPFSSSIKIAYPIIKEFSITIYNLSGKKIKTLSNHSWNGQDTHGNYVPSGIYLIQLKTNGQVFNNRVTLVR